MKNRVCCFLFLFLSALTVSAEETLQLTIGESRIVNVDSPRKVAVGDPRIADVKAVSEKEILLIGKSGGNTTFIVWDKDNAQSTSRVVVLPSDLERQMVEINVQVLEIKKSNVTDLGINWSDTVKALDIAEGSIPPLFQVGDLGRLEKIEFKLNSLLKNGYARILAKPRLLAISGSKASFLSGGQMPVLYQDQSRLTVDWKDYGVKLDIKPTVDLAENINCEIRVEVSNIDASNGANYNGNIIPAIKTRWANTSIYVKKGGTLVIGGLMQTEETKREEGVPLLSDLPLLGLLFKYSHIEKMDSELVIFVTPSLIGK